METPSRSLTVPKQEEQDKMTVSEDSRYDVTWGSRYEMDHWNDEAVLKLLEELVAARLKSDAKAESKALDRLASELHPTRRSVAEGAKNLVPFVITRNSHRLGVISHMLSRNHT